MAGGKLISTGVEFPDATTQTTSGLPLTGGTMTGALTTTGFTSTGIDDNATSTAITIDASEMVQISRSDSNHTTAFTSPHLRLAQSDASTDTTGFVGVTYAASNVDGYGWSAGAVRSTGGNSDFVYKRHIADQVGTEIARFTGTGLCFNGDTAAANALDDYETGTYTPTWGGTFVVGNATTNTATYVKVGDMVTVSFELVFGSTTAITGTAATISMPFTNSTRNAYGIGNYLDTGTTHYVARFELQANVAYAYLHQLVTNATYSQASNVSTNTPMTWTTGDTIKGTITYKAA